MNEYDVNRCTKCFTMILDTNTLCDECKALDSSNKIDLIAELIYQDHHLVFYPYADKWAGLDVVYKRPYLATALKILKIGV